MYNILIIEDDAELRQELSILLKSSGYNPIAIDDFSSTLDQMTAADADLVLLDITLPGHNGEELLQEYRKKKETPVIMLTSRTAEKDEMLSMSFGADDYVVKPYNPTILLLRISAVLKRAKKSNQNVTYNDISVNPTKGTLRRGDHDEILTKNEMIIFQALLERKGEIVPRDALMTALWDNDEFINDNALSVYVSRLRAKLEELGEKDAIETRKKQGYILK